MPKCSYCGKAYEISRGLTFVKTNGNVKHLCSAKCRKNMKMNKRKIRWITKRKESRKEKQKEIQEAAKEEHSDTAEMEQKAAKKAKAKK